jgi:hypothetical protein
MRIHRIDTEYKCPIEQGEQVHVDGDDVRGDFTVSSINLVPDGRGDVEIRVEIMLPKYQVGVSDPYDYDYIEIPESWIEW